MSTASPPPTLRRPPVALAVVALVVALVPLCPPSGLAGAMLGIMVLLRLRAWERGAKAVETARRLALAALFLGALGSIVWSVVLEKAVAAGQAAYDEAASAAVARVIVGAQTDDLDAVRAAWIPSGAIPVPTEADVRRFGAELEARYGAFESFDSISYVKVGPFLGAQLEYAGLFRFERETVAGAVRCRMLMTPGVECRLIGIVVEDGDAGDLALGRMSSSGDREP